MIDFEKSTARFFDWLENVHDKAPQSPVGKIMTANNYSISHTGGGCLAWELTIDDSHYLWICDLGNGLGDSVDEHYLVGCYNADGDFDNAECKGIRNALRWCAKRHADPDKYIAAYQARESRVFAARERARKLAKR